MKGIPTAVLILFGLFALFSRGLTLADGVLVNLTNVAQPAVDWSSYSQTETGHCRLSHSYGRRLLLQAAYAEAVPVLQAGVDCQPHRWAWFDLGRAQWALGQPEAASHSWQQADAYDYVARLARQQTDDTAVAQQYWHLAAQIEPNNAQPLVELGHLLLATDLAQAQTYYQQATAVDPAYAPAYFALGQYYLRHQQQPAQALPYYLQAHQIDPNNMEYLLLLARQTAVADPAAATPYWQTLTNLRPQYGEFWYGLGQSYTQQGCLAEAQDAYKQAIQQQPNSTFAQQAEERLSELDTVTTLPCTANQRP